MRSNRRVSILDAKYGIVDFVFVNLFLLATFWIIKQLSGMPASVFPMVVMAASAALLHVAIHTGTTGWKSSWRFFSIHDAMSCAWSALTAALMVSALFYQLVPAAAWLLFIVATVASVIVPRLVTRVFASHDLFGVASRHWDARRTEDRVKLAPKRF